MNLRPKRPPIGPVPDVHVDPVKVIEAKILATLANARIERAIGAKGADDVHNSQINWLLGEWRKLRGQS